MSAIKRIAILYNPISGAGRAKQRAEQWADLLRNGNFSVVLVEARNASGAQIAGSADLVVVAGGDGTLQRLLPELAEAQVPVYMLPAGNESLFAREFGMSGNAADLLLAIEQGKISSYWLGSVNGSFFHTMVSIGFDADVICRIAKSRHSPIGHIGYLRPAIAAALIHRAPEITLTVDGVRVMENQRGLLIIARTSQYALKLGLVPEAGAFEKKLFARFFPYRLAPQLLYWAVRSKLQDFTRAANLPVFSGDCFDVVAGDHPMQADGEPAGTAPSRVVRSEGCLQVLHGPA